MPSARPDRSTSSSSIFAASANAGRRNSSAIPHALKRLMTAHRLPRRQHADRQGAGACAEGDGGAARSNALVYIGDAMEEQIDDLADKAGNLGLHGVPVFVFQEGQRRRRRDAPSRRSRGCRRAPGSASTAIPPRRWPASLGGRRLRHRRPQGAGGARPAGRPADDRASCGAARPDERSSRHPGRRCWRWRRCSPRSCASTPRRLAAALRLAGPAAARPGRLGAARRTGRAGARRHAAVGRARLVWRRTRLARRAAKTPGKRSTVRTAALEMELDHDTRRAGRPGACRPPRAEDARQR